MEILALKLYIGNKRANTTINQLINTIEDMHFVESGYNEEVLKQHKNQQTNVITQYNYIGNILADRKLTLKNINQRKGIWTNNNILIDEAWIYAQTKPNT